MIYDVVKYKTTRLGLFSTVWAIVKHPVHQTVALAIGELDIAPSKRFIAATSELLGFNGHFSNCKDAKNEIIINFEKDQQNLKKEFEKSIDNECGKVYNKEVAKDTNKNNKLNEESVDMKKSNVGTKVTNVKVVSKVKAESKTRGTEETMKVTFFPTYAQVNSGSGAKYIVTKESCTCPDHMYRGFDKVDEKGVTIKKATVCRHRTAVADVLVKMRNDVKYW